MILVKTATIFDRNNDYFYIYAQGIGILFFKLSRFSKK